jgi:hypothetical protein
MPQLLASIAAVVTGRYSLHTARQGTAEQEADRAFCCRRATLAQLDVRFRALHLYGRHVLDGTHVAVAYLDLATATLHLASSGGCRAVVTTRDALGRSEVRPHCVPDAIGPGLLA